MIKMHRIALAAIAFLTLTLVAATLAADIPKPNPQEAARLNNIGVAYMNQQLFEKALKQFEAAAEKDPGLKVTALNRGVAQLNLQRVDEAKALLEKAAKDDPKDPHAWYNLGLYYKNSADASAAVEAFRHVTEIDPNDADTWYFLGSTHAQLKQFPEAIAAFEHALKLDPLHASAQFGLARAYQQSGQADPAHEAMKKFQYITQNKLGSPISLAYGEQGKYSRAEESPVAVEKVLPQIDVTFVDVTKSAGLPLKADHFAVGAASCFIDYDNDGRTDLFLGSGGPTGGPVLLHNLGGGKFEDITRELGVNQSERASGCTVGDYDNDGFPDLAFTTASGIHLLRNDKAMKFVDMTQASGIFSDRTAGSSGVVWRGLDFVDYDHDGDLDLLGIREAWLPIVGKESKISPLPAEVWRNNGDGTFKNVTGDLGISRKTCHCQHRNRLQQ